MIEIIDQISRLAVTMKMKQLCILFFILNVYFLPSLHAQIRAFNSSTEIEWNTLEEALTKASHSEKMVMLVFHGINCPYSEKMKNDVYSKPDIKKLIEEYFVPAQLYLDKSDEFYYKGVRMNTSQLASIFKVEGSPTITFLNQEGDLIAFQPGYIAPTLFKQLMVYVGTGKYATMSFTEFSELTEEQ